MLAQQYEAVFEHRRGRARRDPTGPQYRPVHAPLSSNCPRLRRWYNQTRSVRLVDGRENNLKLDFPQLNPARFWRRRESHPARTAKLETPLWLDSPDALDRAKRQIRDPEQLRHVTDIIKDGYTVLRNLPTASLCDQVVEDYYRYCLEQHAEDRGKKSRIVNFHIYSEAARALLLDQQVMALLDVLFGYEAVLWTSLTFEYGTEQRLHRDSPHFDTRPPGFYFGVWTALEDVAPEAGPLAFIPGGHRIPSSFDVKTMAKEYLASKDPNAPVDYGYLLEKFFGDMDLQCEKAGLKRQSIEMKKGERLIWHHWMPHGGAPALNPDLTRKSIVGHYIPMGVTVFQCDVFMGVVEANPALWYRYETYANRKYAAHSRSDFQTKYV